MAARDAILLVEDDDAVAGALQVVFQGDGFIVRRASDGRTGLDAFRTASFRLVVLDLHLPDISGTTVLQTLRSQNNWVPVLVLTGYPDFDSAFFTGRLKAVGYFVKPITDFRALLAAVRRAASEPSPTRVPIFLSLWCQF